MFIQKTSTYNVYEIDDWFTLATYKKVLKYTKYAFFIDLNIVGQMIFNSFISEILKRVLRKIPQPSASSLVEKHCLKVENIREML